MLGYAPDMDPTLADYDTLREHGWLVVPSGATDCYVSPDGQTFWDLDDALVECHELLRRGGLQH